MVSWSFRLAMSLMPAYLLSFYFFGVAVIDHFDLQAWSPAQIPLCERKYCKPQTAASVLFAIKSTAASETRRMLIRKTFVRQILEFVPQAAYTFYIANDTSAVTVVQDDMTLLADLPENKKVATTIKTHAFFQTLTVRHDWVCHVDDDSYVQIYRLMHNYLTNAYYYPFRTLIARKRDEPDYLGKAFSYPGGQMYCLSWDLVTAFAHSPLNYTLSGLDEWPADDLLLGLFLSTLIMPFRFVELSNVLAYDVGRSADVYAYAHTPNPEQGINPHKMKTDAQYAAVAAAHELTFAF